jgi:hypothetical protein
MSSFDDGREREAERHDVICNAHTIEGSVKEQQKRVKR